MNSGLLGWLEEVLSRLPLAWLSVGGATGMWWVGPWDGMCRRRGGPPFLPWSWSGLMEGEGPGKVTPEVAV